LRGDDIARPARQHPGLHLAHRPLLPLLAPACAGGLRGAEMHRALAGTSVHLASFPADRGRREPALVAAMAAVRRLATLARAARESKGLRVRQPVAKLQVAVPAAVKGPLFADLLDGILAAEVNAKHVEVVASDHELVTLRGKANFRALGKRCGKETPQAAAAVSQLTAEQLLSLERGEPVWAGQWEFQPEDVTVTREVTTDWV